MGSCIQGYDNVQGVSNKMMHSSNQLLRKFILLVIYILKELLFLNTVFVTTFDDLHRERQDNPFFF